MAPASPRFLYGPALVLQDMHLKLATQKEEHFLKFYIELYENQYFRNLIISCPDSVESLVSFATISRPIPDR